MLFSSTKTARKEPERFLASRPSAAANARPGHLRAKIRRFSRPQLQCSQKKTDVREIILHTHVSKTILGTSCRLVVGVKTEQYDDV